MARIPIEELRELRRKEVPTPIRRGNTAENIIQEIPAYTAQPAARTTVEQVALSNLSETDKKQ